MRWNQWLALTCCLLAFNALTWWWLMPATNQPREALTITEISPLPDSIISGRPQITLRFNQDLQLNDNKAPALSFTPAISGSWEWQPTERRLVFEADEVLPMASEWQLHLPAETLHSQHGASNAEQLISWTTPAPQITSMTTIGHDDSRRLILECVLNQAVDGVELSRHLRLSGDQGRPLPYTIHAQSEATVVRLRLDQQVDHLRRIHAQLTAGMSSREGPIPGTAQRLSVHNQTIPAVTSVSTRHQVTANTAGEITLTFNQRVNTRAMESVLRIEPAIPFALHPSRNGRRLTLRAAFAANTAYHVHISQPADSKLIAQVPAPGRWTARFDHLPPSLHVPHGNGLLVANGARSVAVESINCARLKISIHRLDDHNLAVWRGYAHGQDHAVRRLGQSLGEHLVTIPQDADQRQKLRLDLQQLFAKAEIPSAIQHGVFLLRLQGIAAAHTPATSNWQLRKELVVSFSQIGISVRQGSNEVAVWLHRLDNQAILPGHPVHLYDERQRLVASGTSDEQGFVRLTLPTSHHDDERRIRAVVAHAPTGLDQEISDFSWVDLHQHRLPSLDPQSGIPWQRHGYRALISCGRDILRPGELIQARALIRNRDGSEPPQMPLRWRLWRPNGQLAAEQILTLTSGGVSAWDYHLSDIAESGTWRIDCTLPGDETVLGSEGIQVAELLPQQIAVSMDELNDYYQWSRGADSAISVAASVHWLFGAPANNAQLHLSAELTPSSVTPKGWEGWTFGDKQSVQESHIPGHQRLTLDTLKTNDQGMAHWSLPLASLIGQQRSALSEGAWSLRLIVGGQIDGGRRIHDHRQTTVVVGPHRHALRSVKEDAATVDDQVKQWTIDIARVDHHGKVDGDGEEDFHLQLYRRLWQQQLIERDGSLRWVGRSELEAYGEPQTVNLQSGQTRLSLPLSAAPEEWVVALIDGQGRVRTSLAHGSRHILDRRQPENALLQLVERNGMAMTGAGLSSVDALKAGDELRFRLVSPFAGRIVLSVEQDGVRWWEQLISTDSAHEFGLTVAADWGPNALLCAQIIRPLRDTPSAEASRARAAIALRFANADQHLHSHILVPNEVPPGEEIPIRVRISDQHGQALSGAQVAIAVVDEGWLRLSDYRGPDPFSWWNSYRRHGVEHSDSWRHLLPELPVSEHAVSIGGDAMTIPSAHLNTAAAQDIRLLATHSEWLTTDEQGMVTFQAAAAEQAGAARVMIWAAAGLRFASKEQTIQLRSDFDPLVNWPRFVRPGDQLTLPITIHHRLPANQEFDYHLELPEGWLALEQPRITSLSTEHEQTLRLRIQVGQQLGIQTPTIVLRSGGLERRLSRDIAVRPSQPRSRHHGQLVVNGRATLSSLTPSLLSGQWRLFTNSGHDAILTQAIDSLSHYPYGCAEQTVSRALPWLALVNTDQGWDIEQITVQQRVEQALARLQLMQHNDGGIAMWPGQRHTAPTASLWAAWFAVQAQGAGHKVQPAFLDPLLSWCKNTLRNSALASNEGLPYDELIHRALAGLILAQAGKGQVSDAVRIDDWLTASIDAPHSAAPAELAAIQALTWLYLGRRDHALTLLAAAQTLPPAPRQLTGRLASAAQSRAWRLLAQSQIAPDEAQTAALASAVADDGRSGAWRSTMDRAMASYALLTFRRRFPPLSKHPGLRLMNGAEVLVEVAAGEDFVWDYPHPTLPEELQLAVYGDSPITIDWLAMGVSATPQQPVSAGLSIRRQLLDLDQQPLSQPLQEGQGVIVELSVRADQQTPNTVIEDLLPAGLEAENPLDHGSFARHQRSLANDERWHFRDDRALWFGTVPAHNEFVIRYLARATVAGNYQWPGPRIEAMYDEARHGLGASESLQVVKATASEADEAEQP